MIDQGSIGQSLYVDMHVNVVNDIVFLIKADWMDMRCCWFYFLEGFGFDLDLLNEFTIGWLTGRVRGINQF